jgi:Spy/CpxP family protein refolding chaperone
MTSADFAQRAANQQQSREMAEKRARAESFRTCLVERGYREFALTPEQQAELSRRRKGTEAHVEYLYTLGSDAAVVEKQGLRK